MDETFRLMKQRLDWCSNVWTDEATFGLMALLQLPSVWHRHQYLHINRWILVYPVNSKPGKIRPLPCVTSFTLCLQNPHLAYTPFALLYRHQQCLRRHLHYTIALDIQSISSYSVESSITSLSTLSIFFLKKPQFIWRLCCTLESPW